MTPLASVTLREFHEITLTVASEQRHPARPGWPSTRNSNPDRRSGSRIASPRAGAKPARTLPRPAQTPTVSRERSTPYSKQGN
jgi:hypothetical protein